MFALAALGLIVSLYITLYRLDLVRLVCPRGRIINCKRVLDAKPSVLGIPTYAGGAAFFAVELALVYLGAGLLYLIAYNAIGLIPVAWLLMMQFKSRSVCIYCITVHAVVIASLVLLLLQLS